MGGKNRYYHGGGKEMGKKYIESAKLIDKSTLYSSNEALDLVLKTAKANFDETI